MTGCMRVSNRGFHYDKTAKECKVSNATWQNCENSNSWKRVEDCVLECQGEKVYEQKLYEVEIEARKNTG